MMLMVIKETQSNKVYHISSISEKVPAYYFEEMHELWISDLLRNWDLYVKFPKFEDWSNWINGGTK